MYFTSLGICQVVGDDLLMSNPKRIERAMQEAACNTILLKVNQVGTVTEAIEAVKLARDANWGVVIAQRSGESEDSFIADLSVGLSAGQIKAGAPCRGERLVKYNQLLRIEEEFGGRTLYAGDDWEKLLTVATILFSSNWSPDLPELSSIFFQVNHKSNSPNAVRGPQTPVL